MSIKLSIGKIEDANKYSSYITCNAIYGSVYCVV